MQTGDIIHGFKVEYMEELPELGAVLYRMEYLKNGADLVWLRRDDDNFTFAIGFKTIPEDSTGVFHILEHSLLCGSEKFPCREPFVDLAKGSLQTFLNAMTYPDRTVYPLSSKNFSDFLNLTTVYLDAVFHPLSVKSPYAFMQEGWHYELASPSDELTCNGVVFNEMKGVYASVDELSASLLMKAMFPENCYSEDSGGDPDHIPELTFENYVENYRRFYHPSNARVFLDGDMDIAPVLELISEYFGEYERAPVCADIPSQPPVVSPVVTGRYEISPEEDEKDKVCLTAGYGLCEYDDQLSQTAAEIAARYLCGTNESPLKKILLSRGLAEDIDISVQGDLKQPIVIFSAENTSLDRVDRIWADFEEETRKICAAGMDKSLLTSIINSIEFSVREKDFGTVPKGIIYAMTAFSGWIHGGDPKAPLVYTDTFASLRDKINTDFYERFTEKLFLGNDHMAKVILLPSKTLGEEKLAAEKERLGKIKESWDERRLKEVIEDFKTLQKIQNTPDSPEAAASIPHISVKDISPEVKKTPQELLTPGGCRVFRQPIATNGITYLELYFNICDFEKEDLSKISFIANVLGLLGTEDHSPIELQRETDFYLGRFDTVLRTVSHAGQRDVSTPYFLVRVSVLDANMPHALRLIKEILTGTVFTDRSLIDNFIKQFKTRFFQGIVENGTKIGSYRASASQNMSGYYNEHFYGMTFYDWLKGASAEKAGAGLKNILTEICCRGRLTVGVTGNMDESDIRKLISVFPERPAPEPCHVELFPAVKEAFVIPSDVGFAVTSCRMPDYLEEEQGKTIVLSQLISYDHLWNTVRVKGGAYGTSLSVATGGYETFSSYRDPSACASLEAFKRSGDAVRAFLKSGNPIDSYIISAIAVTEQVRSPRLMGSDECIRRLAGTPEDYLTQIRKQILSSTKEDLERLSYLIDRSFGGSSSCVIAGKKSVAEGSFDTVSVIS